MDIERPMADPFIRRLSFAIVDDNEHMRRLIRAILDSFGATRLFEAGNAEYGLQIIAEYSPDIVVTDLVMPGIDGFEFVRRARSCRPDLPIIMVTGHAERRHVMQARDIGITEFLRKPVSALALLERVRRLAAPSAEICGRISREGAERRDSGSTSPSFHSGHPMDTQSILI